MARAYSCSGSTFTFPPRPAITCAAIRKFQPHPIRASHISTSIPSKRIIIRRKNYLRPKILKTLTKPFPPTPLPEIVPATELTPPIPIQLHSDSDVVLDSPEETHKIEEFETVSGVEKSGNFGIISVKSVLKVFGCFVGVYLLQALLTVWVFGNEDSSDKEKRLYSLDSKANVFMNGDLVSYFDKSEMEEKISEIRTMAREVRETEKMEGKEKGDGEGSEIEKEIGARLVNLEKRLNSKREDLLHDPFMNNYLGFFGNHNEKDDKNSEDDLGLNDHKMLFKKKFRFKGPSMSYRSSPKGFPGSSRINGNTLNDELRESEFEILKPDGGRRDTSMQLNSSQVNGNKVEKGKVDLQKKMDSGADLDTNEGRSSSEATDMVDKGSAMQTNLWWLKLPYVLAILMHRASEPEAGYFGLRATSGEDDQGEPSYTVVFEDRGDANNFCYLLESFFEDLGDFSADIVPLSVQKLHEDVKSRTKKVIVVKKGQLKLYVGQPFAEVEMALLSLLEQDPGTS